jgi:MoxR-like ATPase
MNERPEFDDLARQRIEEFAQRVRAIRDRLHEVLVGQDETIDQLLICALSGGPV